MRRAIKVPAIIICLLPRFGFIPQKRAKRRPEESCVKDITAKAPCLFNDEGLLEVNTLLSGVIVIY
jgi:hypothetical protein